ncbi:probable fatty acid-binding protein [Hyposmocoma kahamanoa]|uniref:probable fatty acid-binding protein n=1 Tax=Hyposmocoma kahamanoa TaxID=1477025 RepID=UPI000E6DA1B5|nr:probable fatty acid-binding protein [Hyposmocoma kahamanoa]
MDNYVGKKYRLKTSDNFENYLKHIEVGYLSRKAAISVTPTACLYKNDDGSYTFTMFTTFRAVDFTFTPGEEFIEERADGVKVKALVVFEGNTLIHTQVEDNGRKSTHVRKFTHDTLTVTTTSEGWDGKCVRVYEILK